MALHDARSAAALALGRGAARLSQFAGRGSGTVVGGRVALALDPAALRWATAQRPTVLITGTNGKSTVTALVAAALDEHGVATNDTGANMPDGIVLALDADRSSPTAVLEVDEVYLERVVANTSPSAIVVLNAFREYTRGISLRRTLQHWRGVAAALPTSCAVIYNTDDPLVVWAFEDAPTRIGVAGALNWRADAVLCPACGSQIAWQGDDWSCRTCGRRRPQPLWSVVGDGIVAGPFGTAAISVDVPGRTGPIGGAFALAAASALGVEQIDAVRRIAAVRDVDGRYRPFPVAGRSARLLMLKNPAGWTEAIDVAVTDRVPLVLAVDPFGPRDTTTMWEAPFDLLRGRRVAVTGARRADALALLAASGVEAGEYADARDAVASQPAGDVIVACNYPAFRRLSRAWRGGAE